MKDQLIVLLRALVQQKKTLVLTVVMIVMRFTFM